MKTAVFLFALVCSTQAAPNVLRRVTRSELPGYSYLAPAVGFGGAPAGAAATGGAAAGGAGASGAGASGAGAGGTNTGGAGAGGAAAGGAAAGEAAAVGAAAGGAAAGQASAVVGITKDERVVEDSGAYSFDVAGEDGTARQESGAPLPEGGISQTGSYSYTQSDGKTFELKYVADAGGFKPESAALPPLPQFVLDQIEFAKNNPEPEGEGSKPPALAAPGAGYLPPTP